MDREGGALSRPGGRVLVVWTMGRGLCCSGPGLVSPGPVQLWTRAPGDGACSELGLQGAGPVRVVTGSGLGLDRDKCWSGPRLDRVWIGSGPSLCLTGSGPGLILDPASEAVSGPHF